MTAANLLVRGDTAFLLTDSAAVDCLDGRLLAEGFKPSIFSEARLVMIWTGNGYGSETRDAATAGRDRLHDAFASLGIDQRATDQASILVAVPAALRLMHEENVRHVGDCDDAHLNIMVAASSDGAGAAYVATSDPDAGLPPFELTRVACLNAAGRAGADEIKLIRSFGESPALADAARFNPWRDGFRLLNAQREACRAAGGWKAVGCKAYLTSVSPRGITTHLIGHWPDRKGVQLGSGIGARLHAIRHQHA